MHKDPAYECDQQTASIASVSLRSLLATHKLLSGCFRQKERKKVVQHLEPTGPLLVTTSSSMHYAAVTIKSVIHGGEMPFIA